MRIRSRLLFAAALLTTAFSINPASAADTAPTRAARIDAEQAGHRQVMLERRAGPKSTAAVTSTLPGLPRANPSRAYPPSCMADPLPDQTSGPTYTATVNLAQYNVNTGGVSTTEAVTIRIWRVVCSSSVFVTSATLMRIQRNVQLDGRTDFYPLFPGIRVSQGGVGFGDTDFPRNILRATIEPNTVLADTLVDTPIVDSMTFVLENYDSSQTSLFDFNLSFGLRFDNFFTSNNQFFLNVPSYTPTSGTYPDAFRDLPISGYLGTNWYDPSASGEGIVLQVYERANDTENLVVSYSWSAYDPSGVPFWLFGQVDIPRGARIASSPMAYRTGGGLGGNSGQASAPIIWGSATVSFPDCNTMVLSYASNPGLPAGIPTGSGTRTWTRVAGVNGLACE
ncbi:MAG TPA: hypothetical protein PLR28_04910 [Dokdonella sp.]|nr:hypothetical protein [Dokdonella sp.]